MREYLFRGKRRDNGVWIYGDLSITAHKCYIDDRLKNMKRVVPETVGQYTDHYDKNRKKIYEGDLVLYCGKTWKVIWSCGFWLEDVEDLGDNLGDICASDIEIIGNIYDNPELLEGGAQK